MTVDARRATRHSIKRGVPRRSSLRGFGVVTRSRIFCWAALAYLTSVASARADWQYTKWGMSPAEVVKASSGQAVANKNPSHDVVQDQDLAKLKAGYATGDFTFEAFFLFHQDKLSTVILELPDAAKCRQLRDLLSSKYGRPGQEKKDAALMFASWRDTEGNNNIRLVQIGSKSCSVYYRPLVSDQNRGL